MAWHAEEATMHIEPRNRSSVQATIKDSEEVCLVRGHGAGKAGTDLKAMPGILCQALP